MDFKKLNVVQLRDECKKKNLCYASLKKSEMIESLIKAEGEKQSTQEEESKSSSLNTQQNISNEMTEAEKIEARSLRFACNKPVKNSSKLSGADALAAEELQKHEERRRRFARPADK